MAFGLENMLPMLLKNMGVDAVSVEAALGTIVQKVNGYDNRFRALETKVAMLEQQAELNNAMLRRALDILEAADKVSISEPPRAPLLDHRGPSA